MHVELYLSDLLSSKLPAQVAALDFNELDFPGWNQPDPVSV
jgi:hypothetical protein